MPQQASVRERLAAASALLENKPQRAFLEVLLAGADPDEVLRLAPQTLAGLAARAFAAANAHRSGDIDLQLFAGADAKEPEEILVAVNDDRPFLYDSALLAAVAAGARLKAAFHPLIDGPNSKQSDAKLSVIVLVMDQLGNQPAREMVLDGLKAAFAQGQSAVRDWKKMLARLKAAREELAAHPPKGHDISEDLAFLDWLADNHFTFLGVRDYALAANGEGDKKNPADENDHGEHGRIVPVADSGLGVLADQNQSVLRAPSKRERPPLSGPVRAFLDAPEPLIVTKAISRSLVHRRAHMDYIGVKRFAADGSFTGEHRFVGLFTSGAYSLSPAAIPLLRQKVAGVMARAGLSPSSHDGKALAHILDSFPRDELFQITEEELFDTAMGILALGGRPKVRLFLRFDRFDRFVSALLFAPSNRVTAETIAKVHALIAEALNGRTSAAHPALEEGPLMRVHYIVGRNEGPRPRVDIKALEQKIETALKNWDDLFLEALCARYGRSEGFNRGARRSARFSAGYRAQFSAHEAVLDLEALEMLGAAKGRKIQAHVWRKDDDAHGALRMKLYVLGEVLPLSASLPIFENLGLKVIAEDAFPVSFQRDDGWREDGAILDFLMEAAESDSDFDSLRAPLEDAFHAVLEGECENDGFNRLVPAAGLSWREITIIRAVAKFLRQAAIAFSQDYMEQALLRHPAFARLLVELFAARLGPAPDSDGDEAAAAAIAADFEARLKDVPSLDDDRILRRFKNVVEQVLRTNFWQKDANGAIKSAIALKLDSEKLDELPAPRPWREIFVYAPAMEGVHLRFGPIARGGIRWSDRKEDFRTEILGLVKAQQVKNAVIVPVGAKGGFYPKTMPANPSREEMQKIGIAAYQTLIGAMLDITDNLDAQGKVLPPADVVRHDGDDPYLVVAADKGTATFSDIANKIAEDRGFWLGDAFASGGSHGYDHKKMGITARGAWEAVKRHFREMGRDVQNEDFTCIGVGDMSGDVFGNGMLQSRHTRLLAAFDHRHIFLDPKGEPATAFAERERLFALPRSSWDDYDRAKLGPGGGVFARSLKEIPLSDEVRALIGSEAKSLTPAQLINALLKAEADLLWFGGIGTFIKAQSQSNAEAGDKANDPVRINGAEVRAKVVGEGANLGVTQLGRIEYALAGGRIDTDAIDNSAGVDTSDHEVNLKILLSGPYRRGEMDSQKRDALLAAMTDEVASLVLKDNYDQTLALSVAEASAAADLDADGRFIRGLERRGKLDRGVEFLPDDAALQRRGHDGKGLTRPELAVLLAYAKLDLDAQIQQSALPDDPALANMLTAYFPPEASGQFPADLKQHRLRREIIATSLANRLVNLAGPVLVSRLTEMTGASAAEVARAFVLADGAFGLESVKGRIDRLDGKIDAALQLRLYGAIALILRRLCLWFLTHASGETDIGAAIVQYRASVEALRGLWPTILSAGQREEADRAVAALADAGVPADLARDIGLMPLLAAAPDLAQLAHSGRDLSAVAKIYFGVGAEIGLDRLRLLAERISVADHWDRLAIRRLVDDLYAAQRAVSKSLIARLAPAESAEAGLAAWAKQEVEPLARTQNFLGQLETSGELSIAKLTLAVSQVHSLALN